MRELLPFILPGIGLYFVLEGSRQLVSSFFRRGRDGDSTSSSSELQKTFAQRWLAWFNVRRGGLFWLGVGLATMWFADGLIPTFVGLFWTAIGGWSVFFASQKSRAKAAAISAAMAAAKTTESQRWSGAVLVAMGLAILWFSGIGIGTAPVAAKPSTETSNALAELVTREVEEAFDRNSHVGLVVAAVYEEYPWRSMGMNWIRSKNDSIGQTVLWHNGGTGGYRSYLGFTEDGQFGVVVVSNTSNSVDDLGQEILEVLVRSLGSEDARHGGSSTSGR